MALPIIVPIAAAAAGAYLLWTKVLKKPSATKVAALTQSVSQQGPRGENVFKPELAESMVRMLASMIYSFPDPNDRRFVKIEAEPSGAPVPKSMSAYGWAESLNTTQSILGHLALATATGSEKFLRAVDPGSEPSYAGGANAAYAVLLYVGTLEKGLAPPGVPPSGSAAPPVPMDDMSRVRSEISDPSVAAAVTDLLQNGKNPDEMLRVAGELERDGITFSAGLLRERAGQLRAAQGQAPLMQPAAQPVYQPPQPPAQPAQPQQQPIAPPPPPPAPSGVETPMIVATQSDPLNLRDAPSGKVIGTMPKGSVFRVMKTDGAWAYGTSAAGQVGWASAQYLSSGGGGGAAPGPAPAPAPAPGGTAYLVTTASDPLNLRSSPNGSVIGTMPKGSTFRVDSTQSGWAHGTSSAGQVGWASLQYLTQQGGLSSGVTALRRRRSVG